MAIDWYPTSLAARVAWHANFAAQAVIDGTAHGLTAGLVTQTGIDSTNVALIVNFIQAVDDFRQAVTAWKDLILEGPIGTALTTSPPAPVVPALGLGSLASIEARTRQMAAMIKASAGITDAILERYGIIGPASPSPTTPSIEGTALTASQVSLAVSKGGYAVVAIDSRVNGGPWVQIGVSMTATYIDARPPLVAGQPEIREFRAQGMLDNARVGAISPSTTVVTVP